MWKILTSRKLGWEHRKEGKPCQDRYLVCRDGERQILAVADGHGGEPYSRSEAGARLACQAAMDILTVPEPDYAQVHVQIKRRFDRLVEEDLAAQPLTGEQQELLGDAPDAYAYGTTLICAVLWPGGVYRYHLGDGELHVVATDGRLLPPLPEDPNCVGFCTSSLVMETAAEDARWSLTHTPAAAAILFTDGYECDTREPWPLLSLLPKLPGTIPAQLLRAGAHGDDQTVVIGSDPELCAEEAFAGNLVKQKNYALQLENARRIHLRVREKDIYIRFLIKKLANYSTLQERGKLIERLTRRHQEFEQVTQDYKQALAAAEQAKPVPPPEPEPTPAEFAFFYELNARHGLQLEPEAVREIYGMDMVRSLESQQETVEQNLVFLLKNGFADTVSDIGNRFAPSLLEDSETFREKAEALMEELGEDYARQLGQDMSVWERMM